jgi:hypothetical protein
MVWLIHLVYREVVFQEASAKEGEQGRVFRLTFQLLGERLGEAYFSQRSLYTTFEMASRFHLMYNA